jgi:hypothetical protein
MECSQTIAELNPMDIKSNDPNSDFAVNPFDLYKEIIKHKMTAKNSVQGDFVAEFYRPSAVNRGRLVPYSVSEPVSSFKGFGHGLYFYFYSTKYFALMFALLTAVAMVQMGFNLSGKGLSDFPNVPVWMRTTLINSPILLQVSNTTVKIQNVTEPITFTEYVSPRALTNELTLSNDTTINNTQLKNKTQDIPQTPANTPVANTTAESPISQPQIPTYSALFYSLSNEFKINIAANSFDRKIEFSLPDARMLCGAFNDFSTTEESGFLCIESFLELTEFDGTGYIKKSKAISSFLLNCKIDESYLTSVNFEDVIMNMCNSTSTQMLSTKISNSVTSDNEIKMSTISDSRIKSSNIYDSKLALFNILVETHVRTSNVNNTSAYKSNVTNSTIKGCQLEKSLVSHSYADSLISVDSIISQCSANYTNSFKTTLILSSSFYYYYHSSTVEKSNLINVASENYAQNLFGSVDMGSIQSSILRHTNVYNSTITNCTIINSDIYNSTLANIYINNAVVIDGKIINRKATSAPIKRRRLQDSSFDKKNQEELVRTYTDKITQIFQALDIAENQKYFQINLICDCVISALFVLLVYALKLIIVREMPSVNSQTMSVSKFTVKITNIPSDVTENDIVAFVKNLTDEPIIRVELAYDFEDTMNLLLKRKDLEEEINDLKAFTDETPKLRRRIDRQQQKHDQIVRQLTIKSMPQLQIDSSEIQKTFNPLYAYVIFNNSLAPQILIENFIKASRQVESGRSEKQFMSDRKVKLSIPDDSRGVNFENITAKITIKIIKLAVFAVAMIGIIVFTTYICNLVEEAIEDSVKAVQCDSSDDDWKLTDVNRGSPQHQCFCDKNIAYILNSQYRKDCGEFILSDASNYYAPFVSVVILTVMNMVIEFIVDQVFDWTGFISKSTETWLKVLVLFTLEYANTVAVLFTTATQEITDIDNPEVKKIQSKLELISPDFYFSTGNKMIMLSFFGSILPHIILLIQCWIKRLIYDHLARIQTLQKRYIRYKQPFEFELDGHYVYLMTSIAAALTFSAAIPVLPLFCFGSFVIAFWINKYIFVKFCRRPIFHDKKLILYVMMVMPFILLFKVFFSISVFGDRSIFFDNSGSEYWIEVLTTENSVSTLDDINGRIVKSLVLVIIVAVLIFLALLEAIGMVVFGSGVAERLSFRKEKAQYYLKEYPTLLYNSTLNYDFRQQPKYQRLLNETKNSELFSFAMVNCSEKQRQQSEFAISQLENNFQEYMETFLFSCQNGSDIVTQTEI